MKKELRVVLDYPYENALCLFITRETNQKFYESIMTKKVASHPYYDFLTSGITKEATKTSLNLAVLFETISVHPIDLPVYDVKDIVTPSKYHDAELSELVHHANGLDVLDPAYQEFLNRFKRPRAREIVTHRINWHLLDSQINDAPIAASNSLLDLYKYKLSRAAHPEQSLPVKEIMKVYETLDSVTGLSFKIDDLETLREIRKDPDVGRFRSQILRYTEILRSNPDKISEIKLEMEETKRRIEQIERFEKYTSWSTYISISVSVVGVLLAGYSLSPIGAVATSIGVSGRLARKIKTWKYSWMLLKRKFH